MVKLCARQAPEHFQAKWIHLAARKMRSKEAFSYFQAKWIHLAARKTLEGAPAKRDKVQGTGTSNSHAVAGKAMDAIMVVNSTAAEASSAPTPWRCASR